MHPALLDAALNGLLLLHQRNEAGSDGVALPFSLGGVRLHREGARTLRVRLARTESEGIGVSAFDEAGQPVLSMSSLAVRPVEPGRLPGAGSAAAGWEALQRLEWIEAPAPPAGEEGERRCVLLGDLELPGAEGERREDLAQLL